MISFFERYRTGWCIYSSCAPSTGFNPRWDCTLSFQLQVPELALVRFVVEDHDHTAKNDFVGQFTVPFTSLRTGAHKDPLYILSNSHHCGVSFVMYVIYSFFSGYRHVHLLKADGSSLSPATLFIHVKVTRKGVPIKTVSARMAIAKGKAWRASELNGKLHFLTTKSFGKEALNVSSETAAAAASRSHSPDLKWSNLHRATSQCRKKDVIYQRRRSTLALSKWIASGWIMNPWSTVGVSGLVSAECSGNRALRIVVHETLWYGICYKIHFNVVNSHV